MPLASGAITTDEKLTFIAIIVSVQDVRLFFTILGKTEILDFFRHCCFNVYEDHKEFVRVNKKLNILITIGVGNRF